MVKSNCQRQTCTRGCVQRWRSQCPVWDRLNVTLLGKGNSNAKLPVVRCLSPASKQAILTRVSINTTPRSEFIVSLKTELANSCYFVQNVERSCWLQIQGKVKHFYADLVLILLISLNLYFHTTMIPFFHCVDVFKDRVTTKTYWWCLWWCWCMEKCRFNRCAVPQMWTPTCILHANSDTICGWTEFDLL